ncbi:DUF4159 domain-containing protein [Puniceicoccales bacterium CK1056]|uniref:DUF4159 domain-containing protein n=1 Tax=Oceanipulchritudo coccoides TaxID=2706888 RepID=A0A6B2M391_9BACT|nr:DUF4159 domain-containing protein [Oceanipulchritudo coccoides]NDV63223.1 DUF4159 domain-containing protein [Oceanipulchritudo coccoides]
MSLRFPVYLFLIGLILFPAALGAQEEATTGQSGLRIVQLVGGEPLRRNHPAGLPSLLLEISRITRFNFSPDPIFIKSFDDPRLFESGIAYVNYADRLDWTLTDGEVTALRAYLQRGGFLYIDAGINSAFLRENAALGQTHSFADWEVTPVLAEQLQRVFPDKNFEALPRSHPVFQGFYSGLPDPTPLPEAIRDFIVKEKWPQGSYSAMALKMDGGRIGVLATPIIAMGWGRDRFGEWSSPISFRVREAAEGMDERLRSAAFSGPRYETTREDGSIEVIYTQPPNVPAWVQEPNGRWRVFRYYHGEEISGYAHTFYTRLGVNIFVYLMTEG